MSIVKRLHTPILSTVTLVFVFAFPVFVDQVAKRFNVSTALVNSANAAKQETRKLFS